MARKPVSSLVMTVNNNMRIASLTLLAAALASLLLLIAASQDGSRAPKITEISEAEKEVNPAPVSTANLENSDKMEKGLLLSPAEVDNIYTARDKLLSKLPPESYRISEYTDRLVRLDNGFQGLSEVTYFPGDDWGKVHDVIAQVVPFGGNEELDLSNKFQREEGTTIYRFTQGIDGVKVENAFLNIMVNEKSGEVVTVRSSLLADDNLPTALISDVEAKNLASRAFAGHGIDLSDFGEAELVYTKRGGEQQRAGVFWTFPAGNHFAYVNAVTGRVQLRDAVLY
jgi:hypothetical protein